MPERARVLSINLKDRLVGHLVNYNGRSAFFVAPEYVADPQRPVLSQAFQGSDEAKTQDLLANLQSNLTVSALRIPPFFANLLPEGALRTRIADGLRVPEDAEFDILAALGRDLPGAVTATLTDQMPPEARRFFGNVVADNVSNHIGISAEKFSLSGIQLKFSVMLNQQKRYILATESDAGDIIAKVPHPAYLHLPENEFSSMRLAQLAGVSTPEFWLDDLSNLHIPGLGELEGKFFAIRRFDRDSGERIHIEDFAQVLNLRPANKYGRANYDTILRIILDRTQNGLSDARQLVRRLVVNILLGNADAHVKNFSLIYYDTNRPDLAPAYDIVSTIQYIPGDHNMALNMVGVKNVESITIESFERLGRRVGMPAPRKLALEARETVQQALETWPAALIDLPMDKSHKKIILSRLQTLPITRS